MVQQLLRMTKRQTMEEHYERKSGMIRMPGEGKAVTLAGKPLVFLVTGEDTKHTSDV